MWIFYPVDNVSDLSFSDVEVATLPSSFQSHCLVNPNRSLPHTCLFRLRPSPNSSFHLRRSASVPSDSDAEGVISLSAFAKLWGRRTRFCVTEAAESFGGCAAPSPSALLVCGASSPEFRLLSTTQGTETFSLTASSAADTQTSSK